MSIPVTPVWSIEVSELSEQDWIDLGNGNEYYCAWADHSNRGTVLAFPQPGHTPEQIEAAMESDARIRLFQRMAAVITIDIPQAGRLDAMRQLSAACQFAHDGHHDTAYVFEDEAAAMAAVNS